MEKTFFKLNSATKRTTFITSQDSIWIILGLFAFFIGRVNIMGAINPLAIAYLSNFLGFGFIFYCISAFMFSSFVFSFSGVFLLKYFMCIFTLTTLNIYLENKNISLNIKNKAVIGTVVAIICSLITCLIARLSIYYYLLTVADAILVFSLTIILDKSIKLMLTKNKSKNISVEELISISILSAAIIAGSADIYIIKFSFKTIYSTLLILIVSYKGGSSFGAMTGIILGLFLYLTGFASIQIPVILSVVGMSVGFFRDKPKIKVVGVFFTSGFLCLLFLEPSLINLSTMYSTSIAVIFFYLLPQNFYLAYIGNSNYDDDIYVSHIKEITNYKLNSTSKSFEKLSKTFKNLSNKKTSLTNEDISTLVDNIVSEACNGCSKYIECWKVNFYDTYKFVFNMLEDCEKNGYMKTENVSSDFFNICIRKEKFINSINNFFGLYQSNLSWKNSIAETRDLVSQQLHGMSTIINSLADELKTEIKFNKELEESIQSEFIKNNLGVDTLIVLENKHGKYEIIMNSTSCFSLKNCSPYISIVNRVIGKKMKKETKYCDHKDTVCSIKLVEEQEFRITSAVSRLTKNGSSESGDSYSFMELKNGKCLLILSDGMGSGKKAREESTATLDLLEDFLESGFDKDISIKIINSILVLKSNDDSFSTLDISSIDLYTGQAEFIKIGAVSTFLLRDGEITIIKSSTLPMGIMSTLDIEISKKLLKNNDILIMMTDGVTELIQSENGTDWLITLIKSFKNKNPQDLSDKIINEIKVISKENVPDDVTVLVSRIWTK